MPPVVAIAAAALAFLFVARASGALGGAGEVPPLERLQLLKNLKLAVYAPYLRAAIERARLAASLSEKVAQFAGWVTFAFTVVATGGDVQAATRAAAAAQRLAALVTSTAGAPAAVVAAVREFKRVTESFIWPTCDRLGIPRDVTIPELDAMIEELIAQVGADAANAAQQAEYDRQNALADARRHASSSQVYNSMTAEQQQEWDDSYESAHAGGGAAEVWT